MAVSKNVIVLDDEDDDEVQITGITSCHGPGDSGSYPLPQEKCSAEPASLDHFGNTGAAAGQPLGTDTTTRASASSSLSRERSDNVVDSAGGSASKNIQTQSVLPATAFPTAPEISPERNANLQPDVGLGASSQQPTADPLPAQTDDEKTAAGESENQIKSLFTPKFFGDMADQVASSFPYNDFAASHGCSVEDVSRALMATVINTLLAKNAGVGLLDEEGDFQMQMDMWNSQYEETVRTLEDGEHSTQLHKQLEQAVESTQDNNVDNSENADTSTATKRSRSEMEAGDTTSTSDDSPTEQRITLPVPEFPDIRPAKKPRTDPTTRAHLQSALRKVPFARGIASQSPVRNVSATLTKALSTAINEPRRHPRPVPAHERHLKYPELSRRRRVIRDDVGSYHTAPIDQEEEFELPGAKGRPAPDYDGRRLPGLLPSPAARGSGPEACVKSLYDVATEKDREVWERLFKRRD